MPELKISARRIGDMESRTEEYEVGFAVDDGEARTVKIRYQAARAYEINAALDSCVGAARDAITDYDPELKQPTDEVLSKSSWRTFQSVKYDGGASKTTTIEL